MSRPMTGRAPALTIRRVGSPRLPRDGSAGDARAMVPRIRQSMVMLLLLAGWLAAGPARAEAARDWERLPDGRVVIEIYGHRFAFPLDMPVGQVEFIHGYRRDPIQPLKTVMQFASLAEVVADRAAAERWWAGPFSNRPVSIFIQGTGAESWFYDGPASSSGRAPRPQVSFALEVYRDRARTHCNSQEFEIGRQYCTTMLDRSRNVAAADASGFIIDRRGSGIRYFWFTDQEQRSQPGDPTYIRINSWPSSFQYENGAGIMPGYFLYPGVVIRYRYVISKENQVDIRQIDDLFRATAARFYLGEVERR